MHERDVAEQGGTSQNTGAETTRQGRRFDSDCDHRARSDMIVAPRAARAICWLRNRAHGLRRVRPAWIRGRCHHACNRREPCDRHHRAHHDREHHCHDLSERRPPRTASGAPREHPTESWPEAHDHASCWSIRPRHGGKLTTTLHALCPRAHACPRLGLSPSPRSPGCVPLSPPRLAPGSVVVCHLRRTPTRPSPSRGGLQMAPTRVRIRSRGRVRAVAPRRI